MAMPSGSLPRAEVPSQPRPKVFSPGTPIGLHLRVERVVRHTPDRILYLVNNLRPRWYTRKCWSCGNKHSPPMAQSCTYCARSLSPRRFLMSARWGIDSESGYEAYVQRRIRGRAVAAPVALYRYREQLLSFFEWSGHSLLVNKPAPVSSEQVMSLCFQLADALGVLHGHGVVLERVTAENVMIAPDGVATLFDLDVERLLKEPIGSSDDLTVAPLKDLRDLAAMLSPFTTLQDPELLDFFKRVRRGGFATGGALAAGVSELAWARSTSPARILASAQTDTGLVRDLNEDNWTWRRLDTDLEVYAVADGMGGHNQGDVASSLVTRTLVRTLGRQTPSDRSAKSLEQALEVAMVACNTALCTVSDERRQHMGTTLVAALVAGRRVIVGGVGDSRAYLLRDGTLTQITEDHSMVAAMIAAGKITPAQARNHPKSNILLQYLGGSKELEPDSFAVDAKPKDRFLLCSDGLWNEVEDTRLQGLLGSDTDLRAVVRRLVRAANDAGGRDNVTALVFEIP